MSYDPNDLVQSESLFSESIAEVFPKLQKAVIQVPNRGTLISNHAIAYCWVKSKTISDLTSIDATDDHVIITVDLSKQPFCGLDKEERDSVIRDFQWELAMWIHHAFYEQLASNSHIFMEEQE